MSIKTNYSHTLRACYIGYITQAIAVNFMPLLFLTFRSTYAISLRQISELIMITFIIQLIVDFVSTRFVSKIGYRVCAVAAHVLAAIGFIMLGILPDALSNPFYGIMTACFFYSFGSGLIEVIISPIVESCPTDHKASAMGFLHSFFCWGTAIVILVSTGFFVAFGIENWRILSMLWAIIPIANTFLFLVVPIAETTDTAECGGPASLLKTKIIWVILLLMLCAGAAELSMSQWASAFAESGLGVSKTAGDIAGPFMFAVTMGTGRIIYSALIKKMDLMTYMVICAALCILGYAAAAFMPGAVTALAGCALVGFAVGVFWPGTFSYAAEKIQGGGAPMFGMLAFAGDAGCTVGPALVGFMSSLFGDSLKKGLVFGIIFPLALMIICLLLRENKGKKRTAK